MRGLSFTLQDQMRHGLLEDLAIMHVMSGGVGCAVSEVARQYIENIVKEADDILLAAMAAGVPASNIVMIDPVVSWDKKQCRYSFDFKVGFLPSGGAF